MSIFYGNFSQTLLILDKNFVKSHKIVVFKCNNVIKYCNKTPKGKSVPDRKGRKEAVRLVN